MAEQMLQFFTQARDFVWGAPLLILLVGTGIYLTILLKGIQLRRLVYSLYLGLVKRKEDSDEPGDISHFQALMTALSATVGTGNIAGVATAITVGGPGALFWMWITGLFGMATKYSEAILAVKYRQVDENGTMSGGPMYYIQNGLKMRWLGILFAIFAAVAAFGIGNMVQSNSVAEALNLSFNIPHVYSGLVLMLLTVMVIIGGIKSIGKVTGFLVPVMIVFYFISAFFIIIIHLDKIPAIFALIFKSAFTGQAAQGGFLGATVMLTIRWGVSRGVFSNESGLGSSPIAAAAAITKHPATQALVSMTQTFIDTIVICTMTGLVILLSGLWTNEPLVTGAKLTSQAFSASLPVVSWLPGNYGGLIVSIGLVLFAYSTILGWSYYGEKSLEFITEIGPNVRRFVSYLLIVILIVPFFIVQNVQQGRTILSVFLILIYVWIFIQIRSKIKKPDLKTITVMYRGAFGVYVLIGTVAQLELVWIMADVFNGLMAFPNLIGLIGLSGIVLKVTNDYFNDKKFNK
ncbi:MAG: sodium:alanine symporter family protein [Calditrichaeota bacterium]|nr:sodium:alanine symporter family protein [Calditrichota bacterium]